MLLNRRDLLRVSAASVGSITLAACTTSDGGGSSTSPGGPSDPDAALRTEVAAAEHALSSLYAALVPDLTGARATQTADLGRRHASYQAAVLPSARATPTVTSASPSTPLSPQAALQQLRGAESAAAAQRLTQSLRAHDPELARTLVLVSAGAAAAAAVIAGWLA